jgi:hypothetical protein
MIVRTPRAQWTPSADESYSPVYVLRGFRRFAYGTSRQVRDANVRGGGLQ